jgi:hypothetical protein
VHAGVDRRYGVTVVAIPEQARLGKQVARSRRVRSDERIVDRMALINRIRPSSTSKMAVAWSPWRNSASSASSKRDFERCRIEFGSQSRWDRECA